MSCLLQTSVELARSQHGLCCNQYVVRKGLRITSQSMGREENCWVWCYAFKEMDQEGTLCVIPRDYFLKFV